jgi:hypothetical protein
MQVNKWFNQETGLAPIDPKALERVKVPQPSFKNVFITGTVSKVIGPDCFELAAISISPHAGNGARLLVVAPYWFNLTRCQIWPG